MRTIEGSRRTHLLPVSAGLIGWRSTLWCEEASHGGEDADGYHHDDAAINRLFRLKRATCFSRLRPAGIGGYTTTVYGGFG